MDISRSIKDFFLLTPYFIALFIGVIMNTLIYLSLSFINAYIVSFLMLAMEHGEASIAIPVANLSFFIALLLSIVLKMETLTPRKLCAMGCALVSIVLLSQA